VTKRKEKDIRKNNEIQTLHKKQKIERHKHTLKTGGVLRCSGRVISSCSNSSTQRVTLATNRVLSQDRIVVMTTESIRGHLWHRYSAMVN